MTQEFPAHRFSRPRGAVSDIRMRDSAGSTDVIVATVIPLLNGRTVSFGNDMCCSAARRIILQPSVGHVRRNGPGGPRPGERF